MLNKILGWVTGLKMETVLVVLVCAILAYACYSLYESGKTRQEAAAAEHAREKADLEYRLSVLQKTLDYSVKALETYERIAAQAQGIRAEADKRLEELYESDPEVCEWGDGVVPDSVWDKLCQPLDPLPGAQTPAAPGGVLGVNP